MLKVTLYVKTSGYRSLLMLSHCITALQRDGFGDRTFFESFVAVNKDTHRIVAYSLYFFTYSTWQGKSLYMEDIYVQPEHRRKGIGLSLLRLMSQVSATLKWQEISYSPGKFLQVACEQNCQRFNFSVLNWNKPSIEFYKSLGANDLTAKEGWHSFRINRAEIERLAQR